MDTVAQKKELRRVMRAARNELDVAVKKEYDRWICFTLEKLVLERNFQTIHVYIPFLSEIDIRELIEKLLEQGKTIVAPKTLPKRQLENRILRSLTETETGIMGTLHPKTSELYEGNFDLIIVPGLAFDSRNFRLGYGGGYYDNFLSRHPEAMKVGIFYPFQRAEVVPTEAHDIKLDQILVKQF